MQIWVTKYALSSGIKEATVDQPEIGSCYVHGRYGGYLQTFIMGSNAFGTRDAAVIDAESRRKKKIASLKKQIEKLEKLTFA